MGYFWRRQVVVCFVLYRFFLPTLLTSCGFRVGKLRGLRPAERASARLQHLELKVLVVEEVCTRRAQRDRQVRHHVAVVPHPQLLGQPRLLLRVDGAVLARQRLGPPHHEHLVPLQLAQVLPVHDDGRVAPCVGGPLEVQRHELPRERVVQVHAGVHVLHVGQGVVARERQRLHAFLVTLLPVAAPLLAQARRRVEDVQRLLVAETLCQLELHERQVPEVVEGAHEGVQALRARVARVVQKRVGEGAAVADRDNVLLVRERLRPDLDGREVQLVDQVRRHHVALQLFVGGAGDLVRLELLAELCKGEHDDQLGDAVRTQRPEVHQQEACRVEDLHQLLLRQAERRLVEAVQERVRVVQLRLLPVLLEVGHTLVPLLGRLALLRRQPQVLRRQLPEVVRRRLVAALDDAVHSKLLDHAQRLPGAVRLLVRLLRVVEAVVERQPLGVGQEDVGGVGQALRRLQQLEGLVPLLHRDVQLHQVLRVADLLVRLAPVRVRVVAPEVLAAQTDGLHLRLAELAAHLDHPRQPPVLAHQRDRLHVVAGGQPEDGGVAGRARLLSPGGLAADEVLQVLVVRADLLGLLPHLQVRVHLDGLLLVSDLAEERRRLLVLALVREDLGQEDAVVDVRAAPVQLDLVEELDVAHVADADERLARGGEVQVRQRLHSQHAPVVLRHAEARDLVPAVVVLLLEVAVERRALRHVDGAHRHVQQAEDLRPLEAYNEALQLLLVDGEVAGLDVQRRVAGEGQHVLVLRVPCNRVRIALLEKQLLRVEAVHDALVVLVDDGQLVAAGRQVKATHRALQLDQVYGEGVVDEDLQHAAVAQPHQKRLALHGAADRLDVADAALQHPLPLRHAGEVVQDELAVEAEDDVLRGDDEQVAVELLHDALLQLVAHLVPVVGDQLVDVDLVGELHCEAVAVDGDLLHVVLAADLQLLLVHKLLDHHVRHVVSERVLVLVQAVHRGEAELVHRNQPVVRAHRNVVRVARLHAGLRPGAGPLLHGPHPVVHLRHRRQPHALLRPQRHLAVAAADEDVLAVAEVRHAARVEAEVPVAPDLLRGQVVERERLVPAPDGQDVEGLFARRVPRERPHGGRALHAQLLVACLVADRDDAVEVPEGQVLPVVRPRARKHLRRHLVLRHTLLLRRPQPEVRRRRRRQLLRRGVVRQALDRVGVLVLQDALGLGRPDDYHLVGSSRRKPLPVLAVRHAVHSVLVSLQAVDRVASRRVRGGVHEHPHAHRRDELGAVGPERHIVHRALPLRVLRYAVLPGGDGLHPCSEGPSRPVRRCLRPPPSPLASPRALLHNRGEKRKTGGGGSRVVSLRDPALCSQ
eukprot:Rhum_TRINITY_DN14297_c3_g1::Rhum_TRINITY_DN14297_c3_g1_i1::g.78660::m.78660